MSQFDDAPSMPTHAAPPYCVPELPVSKGSGSNGGFWGEFRDEDGDLPPGGVLTAGALTTAATVVTPLEDRTAPALFYRIISLISLC